MDATTSKVTNSAVHNRNVHRVWPVDSSGTHHPEAVRAGCFRFLRSRAASSPSTKRYHKLDTVREAHINASAVCTSRHFRTPFNRLS